MAGSSYLGVFEQMVLLAILQLGDSAHAIDIREVIVQRAERRVARGALYATLDRLRKKGSISWKQETAGQHRGGIPRRSFSLTSSGLADLRASQRALARLASGVEHELT